MLIPRINLSMGKEIPLAVTVCPSEWRYCPFLMMMMMMMMLTTKMMMIIVIVIIISYYYKGKVSVSTYTGNLHKRHLWDKTSED